MSTSAREERPDQAGSSASPDLLALRAEAFDARVDAAAIVDETGVILDVNRAWNTFASLNGGESSRTGPGASYLDEALRAAIAGDGDAAAVAMGLHDVLAGRARHFEHRYPCPSLIDERWFVVRITPLASGRGALVSHLDVTELKRTEDRLVHEASHDPLTGLPNRERVVEHLGRALVQAAATGGEVAVLFLDLDDFKPVNDRFGHEVGDRLLVRVADRLRRQLRATDMLGRVGGDEFLAVCAAGDAEQLAERLRAAVAEPAQIGAESVVVGVSIGSAVSTAASGADEAAIRSLLAEADRAMYADKQRRGRER